MIDKNGISFKKNAIIFIDILGYKNRIAEKGFAESVDSFIKNMIDWICQPIKAEYEGKTLLNVTPKALTFTDNIVFFCEIPTDDEITHNAFTNMMLRVSMGLAQYEEDLLVRGAATIGDLYFDEQYKMLQGQGVIDAYLIESQNTIYPRIIINPKIDGIISPILVGWGYDFDGMQYLDYLSIFYCSAKGKQDDVIKECLNKHKQRITNGLKNSIKESQKYYWLANYHNRFCRKFKLNEFLIVDSKMQNYEDTPAYEHSVMKKEREV